MVQDQLVDYVSSQIKLGVSRDAVKAALVGAGWAPVDVDDTLKKVEGSLAQTAAKPAAVVNSSLGGASMGGVTNISGPQSVKMSDLVSASGSAVSFSSSAPASQVQSSKSSTVQSQPKSKAADPVIMKSTSFAASSPSKKSRGGMVFMVIAIIIILALAGGIAYLYFENSGLTAKIATLGNESTGVMAQVATLNTQVQGLDASNTALMSQISSLTDENQTLLTNLSFAAVPPASAGAPATETVSISGLLTTGKNSSFTLTTPYGVLVFVENIKDANVVTALKPLVSTSTLVTLTGTHVPGSQYLTVTAINGSAVQ